MLAAALLLLGCQQAPVGQRVELATIEPGKPATATTAVTPLNSPLQNPTASPSTAAVPATPGPATRTPNVVPTPATGRAVVVGTLANLKSGGVVASIKVFLAKIYYSADGTQAAFGLDIRTSPRTVTSADGYFAFVDVEPGDYLLMVGDPTFAGTVKYSDSTGKDVVLKLNAGQTLNIGEARVSY